MPVLIMLRRVYSVSHCTCVALVPFDVSPSRVILLDDATV